MEKLMEKISGFVEPLAEWVHKMKFLNALAEAMQVLLPITVIGSFACLFAFIDLGPWQAFLAANPMILTAFMNAQSWTLSSIAFYVVLVLPYLYAKRLEMKEPLSCVPLAIAAFLLLTPTQLYTAIPADWLGHKGMFTAFLVVYLVVRFVKYVRITILQLRCQRVIPHYIEATLLF